MANSSTVRRTSLSGQIRTRSSLLTLSAIIAGSLAPAAVLAVPSLCTAAEVRSQSNANALNDVTTVENFGGVSGAQVSRGLGFNINPSNEWEFRMAAEAGAVEGRVQFSWEAVENVSGDLALSASSETALDRFAQYNLQPLIVAAYGPPRRRILTVTAATDVPAGSYVIPVSEDVSSVNPPFCHLQRSSGAQIVAEGKWAYYGAYIHAVDADNRTLTLAARTSVALAAGDTLAINRLSYPSLATTDPNDPSIAAYAHYAAFLANRVDAHGLTGRVELWNEPPWAHDPWDTRYRFYDSPPPELERPAVQFGFAALLQTTLAPGNVRYNWGGSHKSGFNSLLGSRMSPHPTLDQVTNSLSSESYHPYGNTPEDHAWDPVCLADFSRSEFTCHLVGTNPGSNFKSAVRYNLRNLIESGWAIEQNITETGRDTIDQLAKARWIVRHYLLFQALGIQRINFYRLADNGGHFGFVDAITQTPLASYTAIQGLVSDASAIGVSPLPYAPGDLPSVAGYAGTYPLATVGVVGRQSDSDAANSILYVAWQRSYPNMGNWLALPSPDPVSVAVQLPPGLIAQQAYDLVTRSAVTILSTNDGQVIVDVADNPVALLLVPGGASEPRVQADSVKWRATRARLRDSPHRR